MKWMNPRCVKLTIHRIHNELPAGSNSPGFASPLFLASVGKVTVGDLRFHVLLTTHLLPVIKVATTIDCRTTVCNPGVSDRCLGICCSGVTISTRSLSSSLIIFCYSRQKRLSEVWTEIPRKVVVARMSFVVSAIIRTTYRTTVYATSSQALNQNTAPAGPQKPLRRSPAPA